ncbi:MAG: endonuclease/exonuclease/phosphatase family protein [Pseudomonadota bacterium]
MQQEIRFASFNVRNLALPGMAMYDNLPPYTSEQYEAKTSWIAQQIDKLDADVIGFQEIFSQAALKDVLAKSQRYRHAHHAGFDPDPLAKKLTPSVALVSRLPLAGEAIAYLDFPRNLSIPLPDGSAFNRFTRPVLHVQIQLDTELIVNVFVVHLKSKRPDFDQQTDEDNPYHIGLATLRSSIRRNSEALGLHYLLTGFVEHNRVPLVVMGDFNDLVSAVSTQIIMGTQHGKSGFDTRLFDSYRIQSRRDPLRNVGYSVIHDGSYETIDHILVSEEFNPVSRFGLGEVLDVTYLNDHLNLWCDEASDHGAVMARIKLFGAER